MTRVDSGLDALIVGAGPTRLALATQLRNFGARFRIIDRLLDRPRESRALAVQARILELLQLLGIGTTRRAWQYEYLPQAAHHLFHNCAHG